MEGHDAAALRTAGTLALVGGIVAAVANLVHPVIDDTATTEEIIALVGDTWYWTPLHLLIGAGVLILVAAFAVAAPTFPRPRARQAAQAAVVLGVLSGAIFVIQIAGIDGIAFRYLADAGTDAELVALLQDLDVALLSLSIALFMGATAAVFGIALLADARYPSWLGWLAVVAGVGNLVTGLIQSFAGLSDLTVTYLFRPLAGAVIVVIIGFGVTARRLGSPSETEQPVERAPASA
ncbi:MAG: hypothetical protein KY469_14020 [Actinobacteria bacterium]|nr:hypothetical protein [Actinomycetota bacterium]